MNTAMAHQVITGDRSRAPQRRSQPRLSAGMRTHGLATGELVKLHHALADALTTSAGVVTQLVAPEPNAAITHLAYDLAYISASWLNKRVLFVDGTGMRDDASGSSLPIHRESLFATALDPTDLEASMSRVVGLELYQMSFPSMRGALDLAPMLRRIPEFMDRLRQTFDLVVIASPSSEEAPMGVLLAPYVDGTVMVLASGRTRAPVAAKLRDSLRSSGGSVVGVVMTQCRSHAPRWLQRWL